MLLFHLELNPHYQPSAEEMQNMKKAWVQWIGRIAQNARLVSSHQLGFESRLLRANEEPSKLEKLTISGNLVLKATDIEDATHMAKNCPILAAGGQVEIRNTLAIF